MNRCTNRMIRHHLLSLILFTLLLTSSRCLSLTLCTLLIRCRCCCRFRFILLCSYYEQSILTLSTYYLY